MTLAEMQFVLPNLSPASAEIFLLTMACVIMMVDLFVKEKTRALTFALTQITLVGTAAVTVLTSAGLLSIVIAVLLGPDASADLTPRIVEVFGIRTGEEITYTFSSMYVADLMGSVLKLTLYFTVFVVMLYSRSYVLDRPQMAKAEFYTLSLFATLGMMVMISANHFLTIYIGQEVIGRNHHSMT